MPQLIDLGPVKKKGLIDLGPAPTAIMEAIKEVEPETEPEADKSRFIIPGTVQYPIPKEPAKIGVWKPSLKEKVKNTLSDMVERSPFVQPGKRLGQLGVHHLMESVSGLGLYIPDILASKITKEDTLSSAVDKITGFEPTPRDVGAGEAAKFITSLQSVGKVLGPTISRIPARQALKVILGSGITFGTRKTTEEIAKKISAGKPIDVEGIHFESGIGILFGAGEVGISKFAKFIKGFRSLQKTEIRPARAEVNAALKHYQKTGDRTRWDAVRIKYAGIKPEGVSKIKARKAPPKVKGFGKYPLGKPIKTPPTVGKLAPQRPVVPITPEKPAKLPPKGITPDRVRAVAKKFSISEKRARTILERQAVLREPPPIVRGPRLKALRKEEIAPTAKPEWEMTRKEYIEQKRPKDLGERPGETLKSIGLEHENIVFRAIREGKPVPVKVRAEYPHFKPLTKAKPEAVEVAKGLTKAEQAEFEKLKSDFNRQLISFGSPEAKRLVELERKSLAQPPTVAEAEPAKVEKAEEVKPKEFAREAKAEELKTKAEMGIVEIEPSTGVPYWHTAANQGQKDRIMELAGKKAMVGEKGKLKPQFRKIATIYTGEKYIDHLTEEQADTLISILTKFPEPKMKGGKLVPPSIPRTTALTTKGFFQRRFKRPTPATLITANNYYAEKLGVHSLVEPLEKAKMRFDLEHQRASSELDRMGKTIDKIGKTTATERLAAKRKNIPTKARTEIGNLLDSYEEAPANLSPEKKEIFNWFRNLTKTMLARQNEAREKLGMPLIKNRKAYMRHIATDVSRDMLSGKYPFPEGVGFWSGLNVGKKVFNPMEFQRRLEDDVHGLFSTDPVYASKAMMHNALKEIHLNQPLKFFNEQLNALGKDLPEYRNLSPRERAELDKTMVMPADTRRWLMDYVNTVIKGRQTNTDRLVNNIVNESGLKGLLNKVLRPFGRVLSQRPVTRFFQKVGRVQMAGVMGPRPRLLIRNKFQLTQNLALYSTKANVRAFLPPNKELKELLNKSLFLKSYTGLEELPPELAKKIEKLWHKAYQWTATSNARQAMEVSYWDIKELIDNPKYKKYGWKSEHLLKEMEFGASATQYQYNAIGMPAVFRHKSLIPATRLTSWWMNYYAKFHREALHRAFTGRPGWATEKGPTLPWSRRLGWLRYVILGGLILNTLGYTRSYLFGAAPTGWPPAIQCAWNLYLYLITLGSDEKWKQNKNKVAKKRLFSALKTFVPGYIAYKDVEAVWTGRKDLSSLFFYKKYKKPTSEKRKPKLTRPETEKRKTRFEREKRMLR